MMEKIIIVSERYKLAGALCAHVDRFAERIVLVAFGSNDDCLHGLSDELYLLASTSNPPIEALVDWLEQIVYEQDATCVLVESSHLTELVSGRLAARLGTGMLTNTIEYLGNGAGRGLYYGGLAIKEEKFFRKPPFFLFRTEPEIQENELFRKTRTITQEISNRKDRLVRQSRKRSRFGISSLDNASVIIDVGRGLTKESTFEAIQLYASQINAGLSCTLPFADERKWLTKGSVLGISGESVAPEIYLALGVSGQPQHMRGAIRSKMIFAINKDETAPIFEYADVGIVAEIDTVLPELLKGMPSSELGLAEPQRKSVLQL